MISKYYTVWKSKYILVATSSPPIQNKFLRLVPLSHACHTSSYFPMILPLPIFIFIIFMYFFIRTPRNFVPYFIIFIFLRTPSNHSHFLSCFPLSLLTVPPNTRITTSNLPIQWSLRQERKTRRKEGRRRIIVEVENMSEGGSERRTWEEGNSEGGELAWHEERGDW